MFGIINFGAFIISGILLNLTPGTDTMYILSRSISQGKKAGILSALGIASGALIHCIMAALGLSILLANSVIAFTIIKYLGALYLIYLGIRTLLIKSQQLFEVDTSKKKKGDYGKIYLSGILTNVLNPKIALFFLAFLPQFIDTRNANDALPFLILGLSFVFTGTIWCLALASFAGKLSEKIRKNYNFKIWLDKITGIIFILLGLKLAFG